MGFGMAEVATNAWEKASKKSFETHPKEAVEAQINALMADIELLISKFPDMKSMSDKDRATKRIQEIEREIDELKKYMRTIPS